MKKLTNYILFIACFLFASCATVNEFSINVQKPAKVTFPNSVSTMVIANNSIDQPKDINHAAYQYTQEVGKIEIPADGLGNILVEKLADDLVQSNSFDGVFLSTNLPKNDRTFLAAKDLDKTEADSILRKYNGNLLFTLDRYVTMLSADVENIGDGMVRNFYAVKVYADFSIYDKFGAKRNAPIMYSDTLYWSQYSQGQYLFSEPLPTYEEALQGTMAFVADEMAKSLSPQWVESQRWLYSNASTEMRRANVNLNSDKWDEARKIWLELYEKESNLVKKARIASNIALSYELADDLDSALDWVADAKELLDESKKGEEDEDYLRIVYYKNELENRILDFKLLDLQRQQ